MSRTDAPVSQLQLQHALSAFRREMSETAKSVDLRMDDVEARLAQGQHETNELTRSAFAEVRNLVGEVRDAMKDGLDRLATRVGELELRDAIEDGVEKRLKEHVAPVVLPLPPPQSPPTFDKPRAWINAGLIAAGAGVVSLLANLHGAAAVVVHLWNALLESH
jgi:hypothetical protein